MRQTKNLLLLLLLLAGTWQYACKNKYELEPKSFPSVRIIGVDSITKSQATVFFSIGSLENGDPIEYKEIQFYPIDSMQGLRKKEITHDDFVKLEGLLPKKTYTCQILVRTNFKEGGTSEFTSISRNFETPGLTVKTNSKFIEVDKQLQIIAGGFFEDYNDGRDRGDIVRIGHIWNSGSGQERIISIDSSELSNGGTFNTIFTNYNFFETYTVRAFAETTNGEIVVDPNPLIFKSNSPGDFWVDLKDLVEGFQNIPTLEGAISFVLNGKAYFGLGKEPGPNGSYNEKFWEFDPLTMTVNPSASFPTGSERMHASAFVYQNKAYVGLGCNSCEGNKVKPLGDFYSFDGSIWNREHLSLANISGETGPRNDDRDLEDNDDDDNYVFGAHLFVNKGQLILSGGLGRQLKRTRKGNTTDMIITDTPSRGEWFDKNGNNKVDFVEWNDDGDRVYEEGEWDDLNGNGQFDDIEWIDSNGNKKVDNNEVDYELISRGEMWSFELASINNPNSDWKFENDDEINKRYGGSMLQLENYTYLISSDSFPNSEPNSDGNIYYFDTGLVDWKSFALTLLPSSRVFAMSFVIELPNKTLGFMGAGQYTDNQLIPFDLREFSKLDPNSQEHDEITVSPRSACSLTGFSQGVSFSIDDKGYIGLGRVKGGKSTLNNEFWVYVPKVN